MRGVAGEAHVHRDRAVDDLVAALHITMAPDAHVRRDLGAGEDVGGVEVAAIALLIRVGLVDDDRLAGGGLARQALGLCVGVGDTIKEDAQDAVTLLRCRAADGDRQERDPQNHERPPSL